MVHPLVQDSNKKMEKKRVNKVNRLKREEEEREERRERERREREREDGEREGVWILPRERHAALPADWKDGESAREGLLKLGSDGAGIFRRRGKPRELGEGEGVGEGMARSKSAIHGIYQSSMPGHSHRWNRDINGAINICKIYLHLVEFGVEPWEFRKDVELGKIPNYHKLDIAESLDTP